MSVKNDRKFINQFVVVILLLHVVLVGLVVLARVVSAHTQQKYVLLDAGARRAVEDRIAPFANVAVAGADNSGLEIDAPTQGDAAAGPQLELGGKETYEAACSACHATGVTGAPKFGNAGEWAPRIAKGKEVLRDHALHGFQGEKGVMPPKGGRADLSDESVFAAIDYMTGEAQ